jgi:hypothetical protein
MATAEALGQNVDSLVINRSSIHRERSKLRKEQAINLRQGFQINLFNSSVIHWDGKLLPSLTSKKSCRSITSNYFMWKSRTTTRCP